MQAKRMMHDMSEGLGFVSWNVWSIVQKMNARLMRFHSFRLPWVYEALEGWKYVCGQVYNLKT